MPISQPDTEDTVQYIKNRSYDTDYNVSAIEILGEDSANGVLRKVQVDSSGNLKIDPTNLDARWFYSDYFITTDWALNGSNYELTVTHNLDSQDLNITVYEGVNVVLPETIEVIDDNTIKLIVPSDLRFDGTIVVSATKQLTGDMAMLLEDGTYLLLEDGTYLLL